MTKRMLKKYLLFIGILIMILAVVVPTVGAYEGYLVDVRAHVKGEMKATRTPGWWQTHVNAAEYVLVNGYGGTIDMGWPAPITNIADLMGVFWADQKFNTNPDGSKGSKRDDLCFRKAQASFQVLAAILNSGSPDGAPMPVTMAEIQAIMSGSDEDAILALHDLLAAYNLSGDAECLSLGIPEAYMGNATPTQAKLIANEPFANCP